ncbi:hypothetical protein E2C01_024738 [Portunus trituberculatus]|uniref:Uncharacterized protein n=1 Tax=Portunus trituberculatus TaxID=210409 RepID=A0A5B7EDN6_PORTR|nr:hypothetical protein [Portunus trituberculatus]
MPSSYSLWYEVDEKCSVGRLRNVATGGGRRCKDGRRDDTRRVVERTVRSVTGRPPRRDSDLVHRYKCRSSAGSREGKWRPDTAVKDDTLHNGEPSAACQGSRFYQTQERRAKAGRSHAGAKATTRTTQHQDLAQTALWWLLWCYTEVTCRYLLYL